MKNMLSSLLLYYIITFILCCARSFTLLLWSSCGQQTYGSRRKYTEV